jgi:hypothetical protein
MAASSSAILTLFTLVFAGPLCYALRFLYYRFLSTAASTLSKDDQPRDDVPLTQQRNEMDHNAKEPESDEEIVSSSSYMLGLLGYAIGIGNVWRFPYLVGQYGGGAFVFAYMVCLFFIAMPLYFIELGLGQYTRHGTIATFNSKYLAMVPSLVNLCIVLVVYW